MKHLIFTFLLRIKIKQDIKLYKNMLLGKNNYDQKEHEHFGKMIYFRKRELKRIKYITK